ncbi:MAG TPA: hypothetical protein VKA34_11325, partial [Balneolales bacterium]|nr:hypothetical protein [Balneolales bacterium]
MSTAATQLRLSSLARHLVNNGLLKEELAFQLQEQSLQKRIPLVSLLTKEGYLSPSHVAAGAATVLGLPLVDIAAIDLEFLPKDHINEQ